MDFDAAVQAQGLICRRTRLNQLRDPFAATYALTPLGEHAAEFGEYEREMPPPSAARVR